MPDPEIIPSLSRRMTSFNVPLTHTLCGLLEQDGETGGQEGGKKPLKLLSEIFLHLTPEVPLTLLRT